MKYLLQNGIPKWVSDESYPVDAVIIHDHKMWRAVRDNIGVTPGTSADDWTGVASMITDDQGNPITGGVKEIVAGTNITIEEADGVVTINADDQGGGVGKIIAGDNITIEEADGVVTINATGGGGSSGGVGKIIAGAGISVSPASGTGDVTVSSTISAPTTGGKVADIGAWRIIVGECISDTGYKDVVTMSSSLSDVFAIAITENHASGWGAPGPDGEITGTVTAFGTTRHADPDKFYLSVATWDTVRNKWYYPGLTGVGGGVAVQYIAIGQNPDYVEPAAAPAP